MLQLRNICCVRKDLVALDLTSDIVLDVVQWYYKIPIANQVFRKLRFLIIYIFWIKDIISGE